MFRNYQPETLISTGGTINFSVESLTDVLLLKITGGAITLSANQIINFTGTPSDGQEVEVQWNAGTTLDGNDFQINGVKLSALQALYKGRLLFRYIGSAWIASYVGDFFSTGGVSGGVLSAGTVALTKLASATAAYLIVYSSAGVPTAVALSGDATISDAGVITVGTKAITAVKIDDKAVGIGQMDDLARGSVYVGSATNRPSALDIKGANKIIVGDGNDPVSVDVAGDLVMTSPGIFRLASTVGAIFRADLTISAAALATANTTPLDVILAQGTGRTINVIDALVNQTFVAAAYTTNLKLELYTDTATVAQKELTCLDFTTSRITKMKAVEVASAAQTQLIPNKGLKVRVASGDPAAGDGTITITVYYTILT